MADAADLKSAAFNRAFGFKSRRGHSDQLSHNTGRVHRASISSRLMAHSKDQSSSGFLGTQCKEHRDLATCPIFFLRSHARLALPLARPFFQRTHEQTCLRERLDVVLHRAVESYGLDRLFAVRGGTGVHHDFSRVGREVAIDAAVLRAFEGLGLAAFGALAFAFAFVLAS